MEQAYAREAEDTTLIGDVIRICRGHILQRNHVFVVLLTSALMAGLIAGLRYGCYEEKSDMERLLATKACPGCDLSRTNLAGACLSGSNLRGATLKGADLSVADLSHADLRDADLSNASLYRANLIGANLRGANVIGAHLLFADVSRALWTEGRTCPPVRRR